MTAEVESSSSQFLNKKLLGKPEIQIDSPTRSAEWEGSQSTPSPRLKKPVHSPRGAATSGATAQQKYKQMEWLFQLQEVAEGLMTKIYRLRETLELSDNEELQFTDAFWRSGLFPNAPKLCTHVVKKFPEHPVKLLPEKVDKAGMDLLRDNAESYLTSLEPWLLVLVDLMVFREQAWRVILDMSSTVVTFMPHQNPLILHAFMNLFCSFVKVSLYAEKIPRKMLLQMYNLTHTVLRSGKDHEFYHRLVQFVDGSDPPLKGLHEDLSVVSHRVGEILDALGPTIYLGSDLERIRSEGFLSPYHPRYPDKLTNSAHPARAQELAHIYSYREWVLLGYLVCPTELLRTRAIEIVMAELKETLVLPLFRDEYIALHDLYQQFVLPKISESRKMAKTGRKQKEADLEYNVAKQVERSILEAHQVAIYQSDSIHKEHRTILTHELGRMIRFFSDQPSLLAPNIQMVYAALAVTRAELLWYFSHAGLVVSRGKGNRATPVSTDSSDFTIGSLFYSMEKLMVLIRKYASAIKAFSLGFLTGTAQRMRALFQSPGVVALDLESDLRNAFLSIIESLETLPKLQPDKGGLSVLDLRSFRREWLRIITIISSSRSPVNFKHLEKATISTGKESIISEGNTALLWSRSVDDIERLLSQHASLKVLRFYRDHLNTVFRHTMYSPEGRPQNCCAWLRIASTFPENGHYSVSDEPAKLAKDAVMYTETLLESIMLGLEGLINMLEESLARLDQQLLPDKAASRLSHAAKAGFASINKSVRANIELPLPGTESKPSNSESVKQIEAVIQRLTRLCSELNEMEPVRVTSHIFVPREYMRERILSNFRSRIMGVLFPDGELQRPLVVETCVRRQMTIIHLIEQHVGMDLTLGVREVLLKEAFNGQLRNLVPTVDNTRAGGTAAASISDWYIENIIKDEKAAGVVYSPLDKGFRSSKPVGRMAASMVADKRELEAFVRVFGPYGVDKLDKELMEQLSMLLNCIDITFRSNKESLESLAANLQSKKGRDQALRNITELETLMNFSVRVGHILNFRRLLAEAASHVLEGTAPLVHSLISDFAKHAPSCIPEKPPVSRLKMLACLFGASQDQDIRTMQSTLLELGGAGDSTWSLVPYLYIACMTSSVWEDSAFDIHTGGFNNNIHCLARCINALIAAGELVRLERRELARQAIAAQQQQQQQQQSNKRPADEQDGVKLLDSCGASTKLVMKTFLQGASVMALDSSTETSRSGLVAKIVFLDQLCDLSSYLTRSTLETHIPRSLLRSIYQSYYDNSIPTLMSSSRRQPTRAAESERTNIPVTVPASQAQAQHQQQQRQNTFTTTSAELMAEQSKRKEQAQQRFSGPVDVGGDARKAGLSSGASPSSVSRSGPLGSVQA